MLIDTSFLLEPVDSKLSHPSILNTAELGSVIAPEVAGTGVLNDGARTCAAAERGSNASIAGVKATSPAAQMNLRRSIMV